MEKGEFVFVSGCEEMNRGGSLLDGLRVAFIVQDALRCICAGFLAAWLGSNRGVGGTCKLRSRDSHRFSRGHRASFELLARPGNFGFGFASWV